MRLGAGSELMFEPYKHYFDQRLYSKTGKRLGSEKQRLTLAFGFRLLLGNQLLSVERLPGRSCWGLGAGMNSFVEMVEFAWQAEPVEFVELAYLAQLVELDEPVVLVELVDLVELVEPV